MTTTPTLAVIGAPSSAGAHHAGQEQAPRALRERGLLDALADVGLPVTDHGDLPLRAFRADPRNPGARNAADVARSAQDVAAAVRRSARDEQIALVLGGDCTLTLGVVSGLRADADETAGDVGLLYFDGDADLARPGATSSGVLDAMGMAHLLGEAESLVSERLGAAIRLRDDQIAMLGFDTEDAGVYDPAVLARHGELFARSGTEVAQDPVGIARAAREHIERPGRRVVVHFDVDVVESGDLPLGNFPHYGVGLRLDQARDVLTELLRVDGLAAVVLTELNPTHDPSGDQIDRYVAAVASAFGSAFSSASNASMSGPRARS